MKRSDAMNKLENTLCLLKNDFNKRIELNTDLKNISEQICKYYSLGTFVSNDLITTGYEDYNYYLTTTKGKYFVKIFNKNRTKEDIRKHKF